MATNSDEFKYPTDSLTPSTTLLPPPPGQAANRTRTFPLQRQNGSTGLFNFEGEALSSVKDLIGWLAPFILPLLLPRSSSG
jgi:hypothetical protein